MLAWIIGIFVAAVSFYIQVRPRIKNRYFGVDGWRHLMIADYIRVNKKYPKCMDKFLIEAPSDYPPCLRVILSWFPKSFIDRYEWLVCPAIDFCHIMVLFGFVYYFTHNLILAVLSQIIYLSTPLTIMENSNLTTRSLASFLFTLTFVGILGFLFTGSWLFFIYAVAMVSLLLLSHRMSVQAMLFLVVFFTIYDKNILYLLIFALGMGLAIIVSKGFYLTVIKGHLAMLEYWRQNIMYRYAHEVRGLPKKGQKKNTDMVFNIYQKVKSAPFIVVFAANPFVLFVLNFVLIRKFDFYPSVDYFGFNPALMDKFIAWVLFLLIAGIIIRSFRFVEFMGEGERYIEYAAFPISIMGALVVYNSLQTPYANFVLAGFTAFVVLGGIGPAIYFQQKIITHDEERSVKESLWKIFDYINTMRGEVRIMCIPQLMNTSVMYFTKAKTLCTDNSIAHITDLSNVLPVIKKPLKEIFEKYKINYMLVNEHYVGLDELNIEPKEIVKQEGAFYLLKAGEQK